MVKQVEKEGYLSRNKAAYLLGCSEQSISNYANKGYFTSLKADKCLLIEVRSFNQFLETYFEKAKKVDDIENKINSEQKELVEMEKELESRRDFMRGFSEYLALIKCSYTAEMLSEYIQAVNETIDEGSPQTKVAVSMIQDFCRGVSYADLEKRYGLTHDEARKKVWRGMSFIRKNRNYLKSLKEENERLSKRCASQHKTIENYKRENMLLNRRKSLGLSPEEITALAKAMSKTGSVILFNENFSPRAKRVFERLGVESLYDLLKCSKKDFVKLSNCGGKTIKEIEDFISKFSRKNTEYNYQLGCFRCV